MIDRQPHKHAAVIKAWADGAEIECRWPWTKSQPGKWSDWYPTTKPSWNPNHEYRVVLKPQPRRYEEVIKAYYVDNKDIQCRFKDGETYSPWSTWCGAGSNEPFNGTFTDPAGLFNNPKYEFRIKPEEGRSRRDTLKLVFEDGVLVAAEVLK